MKEKYKPENVALRDFRVVKVLRSVSLRITKLFYGTEPKGLLPTMCYCAQTHLNPFFPYWIREMSRESAAERDHWQTNSIE